MRLSRLTFLLALAGLAHSLDAQGQSSVRAGRVRGIVVDSLLGAPLPGATVTMPQVGRTTQSDSTGRFVLDSVPPGDWAIGFHHPALDSLGFSDVESRVRVFAGTSASIVLATPSFAVFRTRLCREGADSLAPTVAFGAVRSVDGSRMRVEVAVSWLKDEDADATRAPPSVRTTPSADNQQWSACGIPWGAWVRATVRDSARTALALFALGERGVAQHDLVLASGVAEVTGTVHDADGRPVRGAQVSVVDSDIRAETDAWGAFTLPAVPAGTRTLDIRAAGRRPWVAPVESGGGPVAVTLQPLVERGERAPMGSDRLRFEGRRNRTGQFMLDGDALAADTSALVQHAPSGACQWWLDGRRVDREFVLAQPRRSWRAVEAYAVGRDAPPEYFATGCAVVMLWTANSDW